MIQNHEAVINQTLFSEIDFLENKKTVLGNKENYEDYLCDANFNKKCRMYREAIAKYLKAYSLIKGCKTLTLN